MAAMKAVGVIPARHESERFPAKALTPIRGVPMVRRVWEGVNSAKTLRALEHGHRVRCAIVDGWRSAPVDVPEDVAKLEVRLAEIGRR